MYPESVRRAVFRMNQLQKEFQQLQEKEKELLQLQKIKRREGDYN